MDPISPTPERENLAGLRLKAESGNFPLTGTSATMTEAFSAEHWQFFAFVFAAVITLIFALFDDALPLVDQWWKGITQRSSEAEIRGLHALVKVSTFIVVAFLTLYNWRVKHFLVCRLTKIKTRSR